MISYAHLRIKQIFFSGIFNYMVFMVEILPDPGNQILEDVYGGQRHVANNTCIHWVHIANAHILLRQFEHQASEAAGEAAGIAHAYTYRIKQNGVVRGPL